jgi:hypothetical protein
MNLMTDLLSMFSSDVSQTLAIKSFNTGYDVLNQAFAERGPRAKLGSRRSNSWLAINLNLKNFIFFKQLKKIENMKEILRYFIGKFCKNFYRNIWLSQRKCLRRPVLSL